MNVSLARSFLILHSLLCNPEVIQDLPGDYKGESLKEQWHDLFVLNCSVTKVNVKKLQYIHYHIIIAG